MPRQYWPGNTSDGARGSSHSAPSGPDVSAFRTGNVTKMMAAIASHGEHAIMDAVPAYEKVRTALAELVLDHGAGSPNGMMLPLERHLLAELNGLWADRSQLPQCKPHELADTMAGRIEREGTPPEIVDRFRAKFWDRHGTPKR